MASVTVTSLGGLAQRILVGDRHEIIADEPAPLGGDTGADPYGLLLGALGSCTAMTVELYAARREWPLEGVAVRLWHERDHAVDCASGGQCDVIHVEVALHGPLEDAQRSQLHQIATRCPLSKTLRRGLDIRYPPREETSDSSASSHAV